MRVFVAIEISKEEILKKIQTFQKNVGIDAKPTKIDQIHFTLEFLGEIDQVKYDQVKDVMEKISFALGQAGKSIAGSNVLLLGLAYKKNVDDDRESVTFKIMEMLEKQGAKTDYNDPYIPIIKPRREYKQFIGKKSVALEQLSFYDLTIILTDHSTYDYSYIVKNSKLVVDTRNACDNIKSEKIIKA